MLLFAGLGNPGSQYEHNRHNVGFMAADAIARRHGFSAWQKKFRALIAEGRIDGQKVLLLKPQTFMNLSGKSVGEVMRFHKLEPAAVTAFYDELDLPPGKVRVKVGGGHGGHNGIRSMDAHCGNGFRRVRIGIGHPGVKELVHGYVLGDFAKADRSWLEPLLEAIADNADYLARGDDNGFMNRIAPPPPTREKAPGKSHIRQARSQPPVAPLPQVGPMAAMLQKILGKSEK